MHTSIENQLEKLEKVPVTVRWNIPSGKTYILWLKSNITKRSQKISQNSVSSWWSLRATHQQDFTDYILGSLVSRCGRKAIRIPKKKKIWWCYAAVMITDVISSTEQYSPATATPSLGTLMLSPDITKLTAALLAALTQVTEIQLHDSRLWKTTTQQTTERFTGTETLQVLYCE